MPSRLCKEALVDNKEGRHTESDCADKGGGRRAPPSTLLWKVGWQVNLARRRIESQQQLKEIDGSQVGDTLQINKQSQHLGVVLYLDIFELLVDVSNKHLVLNAQELSYPLGNPRL